MYWKPSHLKVQLEVHLWAFSQLFPESGPKCPKGAQMEPKDTTMEPQGQSKSTKSRPNVLQGWQNGPPGATTEPQGWQNEAPRSPKVLKRRHKVFQSATKTLKCGPRCQQKRYTDISPYILQDPWSFFQVSAAVLRTSINIYIYIYICIYIYIHIYIYIYI